MSELLDLGAQAPDEGLRVVGERGAVSVAGDEVLRSHHRTVRRLPFEGGAIHGRGHPPPDDRVGEAGGGEQLWHLGDVAEHVRQVADVHHATEGRASSDAGLQVAHERLAGHEELVHQDVPRSDAEPPGRGECPQPLFVLGSDLEIVVDDGDLAVEEEVAVGAVALELVEQPVDQRDQLQPEGLERLVPLAVPVGVGNDRDRSPPLGPAARVAGRTLRFSARCRIAHRSSWPYSAS